MARPDLNIIVCVDPRSCLSHYSQGRNGKDLLEELQDVVAEAQLQDHVQVTPCRCIFGCTYGPRIDVARRWDGDKRLYGTSQGQVTISRRGRVNMHRLPADLAELVRDNLPGA
ncbi:MAG: (2Fe-2S) ferredoxin domain-containing protein [SAR202 cluster bacterium]|nr:(2Fe-2S) ferredoxin domain-containing protein [SAR202 cluster bacterium]